MRHHARVNLLRDPMSAPTAAPRGTPTQQNTFPLTAPGSSKITNCCKCSLPTSDSLKSTCGWVGNEHCHELLPHCWLDELGSPLASCLLVSATHNNYLGWYFFGTAFSLSYISQYVRTTHYRTYNHPIGQFVPYVQNSYFPASLCSPWKYYALYFASKLCQLVIYHPSLEEGGGRGKTRG